MERQEANCDDLECENVSDKAGQQEIKHGVIQNRSQLPEHCQSTGKERILGDADNRDPGLRRAR